MLSPLANPIYRHLFAAQVNALIGTGLLTVALGGVRGAVRPQPRLLAGGISAGGVSGGAEAGALP